MPIEPENPVTLGDKLIRRSKKRVNYTTVLTLSLIAGIVLSWVFSDLLLGAYGAVLFALCLTIFFSSSGKSKAHFLIATDRHGFMKGLKLSDKTVVIDGSNIYHFGLQNGVGKKALKSLVHALRSEGYRVVCFFDANIYFTLLENSEFQKGSQKFSPIILYSIFGLQDYEVYVVPSGVQADQFVIETLSHLPISFAVTNDRFRDYENDYDFLAKDRSWRKGVQIKNGTLSLYQHSFKNPLVM